MIIIWIPYVTFLILQDAARHIARMEAKQKHSQTPLQQALQVLFSFKRAKDEMITKANHCRHPHPMLE